MGNDFYGAIGDVFGTFGLENPDFESEVMLLCDMAPNVDKELIKRLVGAFGELRKAFDDGLASYPYSLRVFKVNRNSLILFCIWKSILKNRLNLF